MTTPAPPPPPAAPGAAPERVAVALSLPLAYARFHCPTCGTVRRFETRLDAGDAGRAYRCKCGAELGRFEVNRAGYTVLRLACA